MSDSVSSNIAKKAMLVTLHRGFWTGKRTNKAKSREIELKEQAESGTATLTTQAIPRSAFSNLLELYYEASRLLEQYTLPWLDGGQRILPSEHFLTFSQKIKDLEIRWNAAADEFAAAYPEYRKTAAQRLGGLLVDLPEPGQIRRRFYIEVHYAPIPTENDFRCTIDKEAVEELQKKVKADLEQSFRESTMSIWQRLHDGVERLVERLRCSRGLRDAVLDNLTKLCRILPGLNILNDPNITQITKDIETQLLNVTADELRVLHDVRQEKAKAADAILARIRTFSAA